MNPLKWGIALAALLSCWGCPRMIWVHRDKTVQQFYHDRGQCMAQAGQATTGLRFTRDVREQVFNDCMLGEGWVLKEER